ncbi:MAG: hypothetical protein NQU46_06455 [Methanolinea sp.]|nr:hypothetical protein [Methanolinea sp.]
MAPGPVIEVGDGEFQLNSFLREYWYLFIFIALFAALSIFLALVFSTLGNSHTLFPIFGLTLDLQVITLGASLLTTYLGIFTLLWTAFEKPFNRPIFYYFIGIEAFKRLLLVIPVFVLATTLTLWISNVYPGVGLVIFSLGGFSAGIVIFSSILVLITRTIRIKNIILATMVYALSVFLVSFSFLLLVTVRRIPEMAIPLVLLMYAMGIAAVFYIIATLIFEIIIPLVRR